MGAILLKIHQENPSYHKIEKVVSILKNGGLMIYPTDTVYGIGCDLYNRKAVEKLCQLRGIKPDKMKLSFICHDLSNVSEYAKGISTPVFKIMKKAIPGPYTFILQSSSKIPKIFGVNKKTVGIRVPNNNITRDIVELLGNPVISTSLKDPDEILEYATDPELMFENYKQVVDIVIDGGFGGNVPSTVLDLSQNDWEIIRKGAGDPSLFY